MSYEDLESSLFGGRPVYYLEFECAGTYYRYNPTKVNKNFLGNTYLSEVLLIGGFRQNKDSVADTTMYITARKDFPISQLFKVIVPARTVWLRIMKNHVGLADSEAKPCWVGRVRGCEWSPGDSRLTCEPIGTMVKRAGLRLHYQTGCNHFLYGPGCGVDPNRFKAFGAITAIAGSDVYANVFAGAPDQYYRLGFVEMNNYFYMVTDHVGDRVTLFCPLEGIKPSEQVTVYAGCNRGLDHCWDKFNNGLNYGGFPWSPNQNIFDVGIGH